MRPGAELVHGGPRRGLQSVRRPDFAVKMDRACQRFAEQVVSDPRSPFDEPFSTRMSPANWTEDSVEAQCVSRACELPMAIRSEGLFICAAPLNLPLELFQLAAPLLKIL